MSVQIQRSPTLAPRSRKVRKNLRLTQSKLDQARKILGAESETDAVEQALDLVAFRDEVLAGVRRLSGGHRLRVNRRRRGAR